MNEQMIDSIHLEKTKSDNFNMDDMRNNLDNDDNEEIEKAQSKEISVSVDMTDNNSKDPKPILSENFNMLAIENNQSNNNNKNGNNNDNNENNQEKKLKFDEIQDLDEGKDNQDNNNENLIQKSDEIPPEVLRARQEWGNIDMQQSLLNELPKEIGVGGVVIDRGYPITYFDARAYLTDQANIQISNQLPELPLPPRKCCFPSKFPPHYREAFETIIKISKLEFIETDLSHHRILNTLHSKITGCTSSPPRKSSQWENIGFQSKDPIQDLRSTGMLGLLLPLGFFIQYPQLGNKLYEISHIQDHEFPLMIILINFVNAILDSIKCSPNILNTGKIIDDSWKQMMCVLAGMMNEISKVWIEQEMDYISDFKFFHDLITAVKNNPLRFSYSPSE